MHGHICKKEATSSLDMSTGGLDFLATFLTLIISAFTLNHGRKARALCVVQSSLDHPDSVRWQHVLARQLRLVDYCFADVTARVALPHNRVDMLIGSQANYEIKLK